MTIAMTLRVDERLKAQLIKLGELRNTPVNKLINQALQQFVVKESFVIEEELEASLQALRQYREQDPNFEQAIREEAEAELAMEHDPAQGDVDLPEAFETTKLVRGLLVG